MADTAVADAVASSSTRARIATLQAKALAVAVAAAVAWTVMQEVYQLEVAMELRVNRSHSRPLGRF